MHQNILDQIESDRLSVHVVWTPVLRSDSRESVEKARRLFTDERITQYWDADQRLGKTYGEIVELPNNRSLAWDIYFAFDKKAQWTDRPPEPATWAHQLGRDERSLGDGETLRAAIEELLNDSN